MWLCLVRVWGAVGLVWCGNFVVLDGRWYCFGSGFWVLVCGLVALGLVVVYGGCRLC